jgi:hypothetical protein
MQGVLHSVLQLAACIVSDDLNHQKIRRLLPSRRRSHACMLLCLDALKAPAAAACAASQGAHASVRHCRRRDLDKNALSGTLPASWSALTGLRNV